MAVNTELSIFFFCNWLLVMAEEKRGFIFSSAEQEMVISVSSNIGLNWCSLRTCGG